MFGKKFLGISEMEFSRGSVVVNSVVRLSSPPSSHDEANISTGVVDTFARNGLLVDDFSLVKTGIRVLALIFSSFQE